MSLSRVEDVLSWVFQIAAAVILLQTLFFKFTGAEESVYIFSTLGLEPWGRIGSGIVELIASVLLLIPSTVSLGAVLSMGVTGLLGYGKDRAPLFLRAADVEDSELEPGAYS
ncbi:MAG TPA: hypothetical protein VE262_11575 [Blastocatellia bacterium]|nr:hypothetical protein [Blastocatellia bacterium]